MSLMPVEINRAQVLATLGLNERDAKTQALMLVAQKYALDPILKQIMLIKGNPYITRDGYLTIAHAHPQFDGMQVIEETETEHGYICKVAVYRRDMRYPFVATGRATKSSDSNGPAPVDMALARAERRALKRAFNVCGIGTGDVDDEVLEQEVGRGDYVEVAKPARDAHLAIGSGSAIAVDQEQRNENRVAALAAMSEIGVKSEEDRHKLVLAATNGATESTRDLTDEQVDAIRDYSKSRHSSQSVNNDETGEVASAEVVARFRQRVALLDDEKALDEFKGEWRKSNIGGIKEGGRQLLASEVKEFGMCLDYAEQFQDDAWERRRKAANAAMSDVGIKTNDGRRDFVLQVTDGQSDSISNLTSDQFDAIKVACERLAAEDEGQNSEVAS